MAAETVIDGIRVFNIPLQRAMGIAQEYGSKMSSQKINALLAASTDLTATQVAALPAATYMRISIEVMKRLTARMQAATR